MKKIPHYIVFYVYRIVPESQFHAYTTWFRLASLKHLAPVFNLIYNVESQLAQETSDGSDKVVICWFKFWNSADSLRQHFLMFVILALCVGELSCCRSMRLRSTNVGHSNHYILAVLDTICGVWSSAFTKWPSETRSKWNTPSDQGFHIDARPVLWQQCLLNE